jgi:hypothetical protein
MKSNNLQIYMEFKYIALYLLNEKNEFQLFSIQYRIYILKTKFTEQI